MSVPAPPLEREYEGWFTRALEDYLELLGARPIVFVVSPKLERRWPADVASIVEPGKVVGFQLKRPEYISAGTSDGLNSLRWDISRPYHQRQLIKSRKEIYYAFPTFTERRFRRGCLQHFVLWRRDQRLPKRVCYGAPPDRSYVGRVGREGERWGSFYERLLSCDIGAEVEEEGLPLYLADLLEELTPPAEDVRDELEFQLDLLFVPGRFDDTRAGRRFVPTT